MLTRVKLVLTHKGIVKTPYTIRKRKIIMHTKNELDPRMHNIVRKMLAEKGTVAFKNLSDYGSTWEDYNFACDHGEENITWEVDESNTPYEMVYRLFEGTFADREIVTVLLVDGANSTDGRFTDKTLGIQMDMRDILMYVLDEMEN